MERAGGKRVVYLGHAETLRHSPRFLGLTTLYGLIRGRHAFVLSWLTCLVLVFIIVDSGEYTLDHPLHGSPVNQPLISTTDTQNSFDQTIVQLLITTKRLV